MSTPEARQIASTIDAILQDHVSTALLSLDKSLALKPKRIPASVVLTFSSAQLKIIRSSLDEVAMSAQKRQDSVCTSFKMGLQDAKELQRELSELEKRVRALKDKVRERWPVEYYTVRDETDG